MIEKESERERERERVERKRMENGKDSKSSFKPIYLVASFVFQGVAYIPYINTHIQKIIILS